MSNQIGNYVHYYYNNYKLYGNARKLKRSLGGEEKGDIYKYVSQEKEKIKISLNVAKEQAIINDLQQQIDYIMGPGQFDTKGEKILTNTQQAIGQYLIDMFSDIKITDIDFETMTLTPEAQKRIAKTPHVLENITDALTKKALLGHYIGKGKKVEYAPIIKHIRQLAQASSQLKLSDGTKIQEIQKQLASIKKRANTLFGTQKTVETSLASSLLTDLTEVGKTILAVSAISKIEGTLGEAAIAAAALGLQNNLSKGIDEILKALEKAVVGSNKAAVVYDKSLIAKSGRNNNSFKKGYSDDTVSWSTTMGVDGKIDVQVILKDGTELGVSVKNYNYLGGKDIKLVSGTNLLYMLQTLGSFTNHYLNQASIRDKTQANATSSIVNNANEALQQMINIRALTGGGLRKGNNSLSGKTANIFAINDKSKKSGFKIMTMNSILIKAIQFPDLLTGTRATDFKINNNWAPTVDQRINILISQLKQAKVNLSININKASVL